VRSQALVAGARKLANHSYLGKRTIALEFRHRHCEAQFTHPCKLQSWARSQRKASHLHTIVALACLVLDTTVMWDLIFIVATAAFFAVSLAYVEGCQRL
jgi:hypothetical protein